jgi:hypothetical protein
VQKDDGITRPHIHIADLTVEDLDPASWVGIVGTDRRIRRIIHCCRSECPSPQIKFSGSHLVAACGYQCPRRNVALIMKATETRWVGGAWERHRRAAAAIEKAAAEFNVPATKLMAMRR